MLQSILGHAYNCMYLYELEAYESQRLGTYNKAGLILFYTETVKGHNV